MTQCKIIMFLTMFAILSATSTYASEVTVLTEQMPPYNHSDQNNNITGFSTEIVKEILKRADIKIAGGKIKIYPWARAYKMTERNKNTLLYSMTRSEKRENRFKWVGPIASRTIWFWKLKKRDDISVKSIEDIKNYRIGAVSEFSSAKYMQDLGFHLDFCNNEEINFKKLLANRFDILTALELAAAYHMNKQKRSFNDLEKLVKLDDRYDYYLALNINTSDEIVDALQNALDNTKKDGTYNRIKQMHLK